MGAISNKRSSFLAMICELVGFKAGLSLNRENMAELSPQYSFLWEGNDDDFLRVRSETLEEIVTNLLHQVGAIEHPYSVFPGIRMFHQVKNDPEKFQIYKDVFGLWIEMFDDLMKEAIESGTKLINPIPFIERAVELHPSRLALEVAYNLLSEINLSLYQSPWSRMRSVEWNDTIELAALFKSESLETQYGAFFDQRFIDFLHRNFDLISNINWRKFEGLVGEFFDREGFHVELGAGRNDGSIDARIWPKNEKEDRPPLILIQCKRQQKKVEKVVVKALYADIIDEGATSGFIVTTSSLSPGARQVCTVRSYPISEIDRNKLQEWILKLRTPFTGVFLEE